MRRAIAFLFALTLAFAGDPPAGEVNGPVTYTSTGVRLGQKTIPWKAIKTLTETDPAPPADDGDEKKRAARDKDKEVFTQKLAALDKTKKGAELELAKWCQAHALLDEEKQLVTELLVKDAWDREAIRLMKPLVDGRAPKTALRPPFAGRWKGLVDSTGHHQIKCFAIYAIDFVKVDAKGAMCSGKGTELTDFYGYDQEILAAADGVVSMVDDHFPDLPVGVTGKFDQANFVSIEHEGGEHTDYGHIHKGSAKVKVGDHVKKGQVIAHVGTSGAAGLPHLHFTMSMAIFSPGIDHGQWLAVPYRFSDFQVSEANGAPCSFEVKSARPQEGWILECPAP